VFWQASPAKNTHFPRFMEMVFLQDKTKSARVTIAPALFS
jgi:hypothetical protein